MFNIVKKEIIWNGDVLSIETGKIARQASGAVLVRYKKSAILCAVTVAEKPSEGINFLPLSVHYIEKFYASGKIPGGFFKRETKPSEAEILTSRLIDRSIRPIISHNFYNDINVICTVMSHDSSCNNDVLALLGASAAISISKVPYDYPVVGVRVGLIDGDFVIDPSSENLKNSDLDLVVAGTETSILMVESEAKQLNEKTMLSAAEFGQKSFQPLIAMIKEFRSEVGNSDKLPLCQNHSSELEAVVSSEFLSKVQSAYSIANKLQRKSSLDSVLEEIKSKFVNEKTSANLIAAIFEKICSVVVRNNILLNNHRIDGRKTNEIRNITCEIGLLPSTHGSSLFTRGETQAVVVTTLGTTKDRQLIETLGQNMTEQAFMMHYNFPPYSVGEVGQMRTPGRRELGHGKLAWRAINQVLPNPESFSYTIRVVSEITESNGSSSMATVCGASLSLMDAGVPLTSPVSGIAMGLIKEGDNYAILSDIMGDEDHLGDMDFKVAGTAQGITALQMDIKIDGITIEIMERALTQAKEGRIHILEKMSQAISKPREELNGNVPRTESFTIPQKKIREVIGAKGVVIKDICAVSGATVDIEDSGVVKVSSSSSESIGKAIEMIKGIVFEPEMGDIYEGPVVKIIESGAFVAMSPSKDGFVHISELADYRVDCVERIFNEGDIVKVKVIGFDKKGRPKLSYRCVDQITGEDITESMQNKPTMIDERESSFSGKRGSDRNHDRNSSSEKKKKGFFS